MEKCKSIGKTLTFLKLWFLSQFCRSGKVEEQVKTIILDLTALQYIDLNRLKEIENLLVSYGYIRNGKVLLPIKNSTKKTLLTSLTPDYDFFDEEYHKHFNINVFYN